MHSFVPLFYTMLFKQILWNASQKEKHCQDNFNDKKSQYAAL